MQQLPASEKTKISHELAQVQAGDKVLFTNQVGYKTVQVVSAVSKGSIFVEKVAGQPIQFNKADGFEFNARWAFRCRVDAITPERWGDKQQAMNTMFGADVLSKYGRSYREKWGAKYGEVAE